jgi:acetyl-CoA C-acetyltransferase
MRRVAIVGAGMTKFGEHWESGIRELIAEAGTAAIMDAHMDGKSIDGLFGGTMASGRFVGQEHIAALIADYMGLNPIASTRVEAACASGGLALRTGFMAVASGLHNHVVVGGVEKMTDVAADEATVALGGAGDQEWELALGATFPALYALMARRHMIEYGTTEEHFASVSVKNHANAAKNKYAQFQKEITIQDVLESRPVASPLKILDCSPVSDGAAAVILVPLEDAKKYTDTPVEIIASAHATDTIALSSRKSLTELNATKVAVKKAYEMSKTSPKDIDLCEVHDCFTCAEVMAIEDLGFFPKGQGGPVSLEGRTKIGGDIAINTSGGLKGCGHPVGATGVKQAVEIFWQLQGRAERRQVNGAEIGMTHNVGGSGATAIIHVYKRV